VAASPEGESCGCLCGSSNGGDQRIFSAKPADMNIVGSVATHWEGFSFSDSMLMISSRKMGDVSMCILLCAIYRAPNRVA
jgi:hypothetical protein